MRCAENPFSICAGRRNVLLSTSVLALTLSLPGLAAAQESGTKLEEVVVTAQKREQRLQDVPVAVTAVTGDTLAANRIVTTRDLSSIAPNLVVREQFGASALPLYSMRGEFASSNTIGADRGVGVYIDGVYMGSSTGSMVELANLARVEVLRGPQGTLFGRNSTAGAISLYTREPAADFGVDQTLTLGNFDHFRSSTILNTGEVGDFSATLTYTHSQRRGDIRNVAGGTRWDFTPSYGYPKFFTSPKWMGSNNTEAVSGAIKFQPEGGLKAIYRFDWNETHVTAAGVGLGYAQPSLRALFVGQPANLVPQIATERPDAVNNGTTVPGRQEWQGHSLTLEYAISDNLSIKNIFAYRKSDYIAPLTDITGTGLLFNTGSAAFAGFGVPQTAATLNAPFSVQASVGAGGDRQLSDEVQINYNSDFVTITTGGMWFRNKQSRSQPGEEQGIGRVRSGAFRVFPNYQLPWAGGQLAGSMGRSSQITTKSVAVYGQAEFHVTDQIDVIAGGRYTKDKKYGIDRTLFTGANATQVPPAIFAVDYSSDKFTYNLGVNYKPTTDTLIYGKYATGYISGGALSGLSFDPVTAKSWEGGVKADWLDGRLRTNIAVFDVKYGNLQIGVSGNLLTPRRPDVPTALTNAGSAHAKGFEFESQLVPLDGLTLSFNAGHTDFKYTSLSSLLTTGNAEIFPTTRPKWTVNLSAQYETQPLFDDVTLTARVDGNWSSKFYAVFGLPVTTATFTAAEQAAYRDTLTIDPYWIVNARLTLKGFQVAGRDASVSLWSRNLLDEKSASYAQSVVTAIGLMYEFSRTVGVDLNVKF